MVMIQRSRDGALLVSEEENPSGELFHRPLGGHVEFGEYALNTVHRELREEIGQALTSIPGGGVECVPARRTGCAWVRSCR